MSEVFVTVYCINFNFNQWRPIETYLVILCVCGVYVRGADVCVCIFVRRKRRKV